MVGTKVGVLQGGRGTRFRQQACWGLCPCPVILSHATMCHQVLAHNWGMGPRAVPQGRDQRTQEVWTILVPTFRAGRALSPAKWQLVSHRSCLQGGTASSQPSRALWAPQEADNCGHLGLGFTLNISGAGRSKPSVPQQPRSRV